MMIKLVTLIFVFVLTSCVPTTKKVSQGLNYFSKMKGCFLLYNIKTKTFDKTIGDSTCRQQFPACSSFKLPLAVMAFDSGILKDENIILKWDGKKESREEVNRDHNAKTWIRDSVVWFSQRITPQLGAKKLQKYLDDFDYGNKDISSGLKDAWLLSPTNPKTPLKISAYEQVVFMEKLWTDNLPVSKESMRLTREISFLETSPKGYRLSGKTGSNFYDKEHKIHFGWFISNLKNKDQEYIVVTNLSDLEPTDQKGYGGARAKAITKQILSDLGLW